MPAANGNNQPATRADVRALEAQLEGRLQQVEDQIRQLNTNTLPRLRCS
jgi:hypothetical protein